MERVVEMHCSFHNQTPFQNGTKCMFLEKKTLIKCSGICNYILITLKQYEEPGFQRLKDS